MDVETQAVGAAIEPSDASPSVETAVIAEPEVPATPAQDDADWEPHPDDPPSVQERIKSLSATTRAERERAAQLEQQLAGYQELDALTPWTPVITRLADQGYTADQIAEYLDRQAQAPQPEPAQEPLTDPFDAWLVKTTNYTAEDLPDYLVPLYRGQFETAQWREQQVAQQQAAEVQQAATLLATQEAELTNALPAFKSDVLMQPLMAYAANRWASGDARSLKQMGEEMWQVIQAQSQHAVAQSLQAQSLRNASVPPVTAGGGAVPPSPPNPMETNIFDAPRIKQADYVAEFMKARNAEV